MASLKAIKNNYNLLTKQERFGLYQRACLRKDEPEIEAIISASPKKPYDVYDFNFLREEVFRIDTINLLQRLGHFSMFELFMSYANGDDKRAERHIYSACLSAYLYSIDTNAWQIVCDDLGFEVNWFRQIASEISFAVGMMEIKDEVIQEMAFSKDEAQKFMRDFHKEKSSVIKTIEEQIKFYRSAIEEI